MRKGIPVGGSPTVTQLSSEKIKQNTGVQNPNPGLTHKLNASEVARNPRKTIVEKGRSKSKSNKL